MAVENACFLTASHGLLDVIDCYSKVMINYPIKPLFLLPAIYAATFAPIAMPDLLADGLGDAYLAEVRNGFEARQANALQQQMFTPTPTLTDPEASSTYGWNRLGFALAALFTYKEDAAAHQNFINAANRAIIDTCEQYLHAGPDVITRQEGGEGGMHWVGNHLVRLHEYFASDSRFYPGLLSEQAESNLRALIWMWVSNSRKIEYADLTVNNSWRIRSSENHSAMMDQLAWGGAQILRRFEPYKSMEYNDGSTAEQQYEAWTQFLIQYLRERGMRGLFVEYHSNTYTKYTMQNIYNYFDLSEKPVLREMARSVLDLMWADAAHGTLDDVVGGAATRNARPSDLNPIRNGFSGLKWYHYGKGQAMNRHPGHMMLITSHYRIPKVIMDIALDIEGRGSYEYISRKPGLILEGTGNLFIGETRQNYIDYENHRILRYSYVTPDFVLGSQVLPRLSNDDWSNISSQNRFQSALLRTDGSDFVQIVPQARGTGNLDRSLNESWSIQRHGTLIVQKLREAVNTAEMRVYIPSGARVTVEEVENWIFINTGYTFSGVRVATGGYQWQDDEWIELNDEYSPVIVEVVRSQNFVDFEAFKAAALSTPIEVISENGNRRLEYTGLNDSGEFVFHMDTDELPTVNGEPYDLTPDYTYKSPFINSGWPGSTVTIEKGNRSLTLDFDLELPDPEAMNPQWRNSVYVDRRWYHLDGFGWFVPMGDDWLYHYEMGFLFAPSAPGSSVWLFHENSREWIWTSTAFRGYYTPTGDTFDPNAP